MNPKVFVSHASEDKNRFVTEFATKLRKNGVDAWLDKWEMLPGDSLVDKIFEEGLKKAEAIIIVLSKFSVDKPWVREELNASIVNKISKGVRIIPIVLDDCNVPESLISTLWEKVENLESYDNSFKKILYAIYGINDKPALGASPAYTTTVYHEIGGLTKADNLVLKETCDFMVQKDSYLLLVNPETVFGDGSKLGFSKVEIEDCIEVLENNGYFNVTRFIGGGESYGCRIQVTENGFDSYLQAYVDDYNSIIEKVISLVVNEGVVSNIEIFSKLNKPKVIVNNILIALESRSHIKLSKFTDGSIHIYHVSASLRRLLAL
jgi:hypothetical protein